MRILFDVSRTISRLHYETPTGIDRVELAYLTHIRRNYPNSFAIARLGREYLFAPVEDFDEFCGSVDLARPAGLRDQFRYKLLPEQRRVKASLRKRFGWLGRREFENALSSLENVATYINVGHSRAMMDHWQWLNEKGVNIWTMIHDVIPLTHPQFTRAGQSEKFRAFLQAVSETSSRIIFVSDFSRTSAAEFVRLPETIIAAPGIDTQFFKPLPKSREPFVLFVGTVEPRKNVELLLELWKNPPVSKSGKDLKLLMVGQEGWSGRDVFKEIQHLGSEGFVEHVTGASDTKLSDLYSRCAATVFPSFVEGFGLPLYEAIAMEAPVLASDIPVFRSALGSQAQLLDPTDETAWRDALKKPEEHIYSVESPTWDRHFEQVGL